MIIELAATNEDLAELAEVEGRRHAPRTPERRTAGALRAALITTRTIDAARTALAGFAAPDVQAPAIALLHKLAAELAAAETTPAEGGNKP